MNRHLVVARYNENIGWLSEITIPFTVITKGVELPNTGRETTSYLYFILKNYDTLEGQYAFVQGKPFDHAPNAIAEINTIQDTHYKEIGQAYYRCDMNGYPQHTGLPISSFWREIGLPIKEFIDFHAGAQFIVSAERIKKYPKEYYQLLFDLTLEYPQGPWIMERTWRELFR